MIAMKSLKQLTGQLKEWFLLLRTKEIAEAAGLSLLLAPLNLSSFSKDRLSASQNNNL